MKTVGMSLLLADYFGQYSPPFFSRHCLHSRLSTTQDDYDWFRDQSKQCCGWRELLL